MENISKLQTKDKQELWQKMHSICQYNHARFFSPDFHNDIINEYHTNLDCAVSQMSQYRNASYFRKLLRLKGSVTKVLNTTFKKLTLTRPHLIEFWKFIKDGKLDAKRRPNHHQVD